MISLIYITCPNVKEARNLAEQMLGERLAGCANIIPKMMSIYHWKGKLESAEEAVLLLKTAPDKVAECLRRIQQLHSYDTPCALEISVGQGLDKYQEWVIAETRKEKAK